MNDRLRIILTFMNIFLVVVILFWGVQLIGYKRQLAEINGKQIEECYYLDCEADIWGSLECKGKPMPRQIIGDWESENSTYPTRER